MPFKSKSQARFFFAAEDRGELPKGTAKRWAKHTPDIKKLPEKKKSEKKAFVHAFVSTFLEKLGMTQESFAGTALAQAMVKVAVIDVPEAADSAKLIDEGVKAQKAWLAMHIGTPAALGAAAGAGLAKLFSPSDVAVGNLQKKELLTHYDAAIKELERRIASRRG